MASWLPVIILSYFFFSLGYLGDKLVLASAPRPKSYTFYIGLLSILVIVFIPFISFHAPSPIAMLWIFLESIVYIAGLYLMFLVLEKSEVSVVITTIGATQPIFIFILTWLFWGAQVITGVNVVAFLLLLAGSVIISLNKKFTISKEYLTLTILASLMFSFDYIFSKLVFLHQPFLQGFIWMRIASFILVLLFLLSRKFRKEIFQKQHIPDVKTSLIFFATQASGGVANLLQNLAIFLAPVAFLPIINALRGIQYVFLFLMTLFFSLFLPRILKEDISRRLLVLKIISIVLIVAALVMLSV